MAFCEAFCGAQPGVLWGGVAYRQGTGGTITGFLRTFSSGMVNILDRNIHRHQSAEGRFSFDLLFEVPGLQQTVPEWVGRLSANGEPLSRAEKTVGILIYPDAEVLDFCGLFEVFATTRLDEESRRESESPIHQVLVGESTELVRASGGMRIMPDVDFATCPSLDMLLVPGGHGIRALMHQPEYLDWLKRMAPRVDRLASVGTGSLLLAEAGLLVGKTATTHFHSVDFFRERFPSTSLLPELPMVVDGNITTASSIRAGIDMALYLVAQTYGQIVARAAAQQMEYPYPDEQNFRTRNQKR